MRREGEPEISYLIHLEVSDADVIGPKRVFIIGFGGDSIIYLVSECASDNTVYKDNSQLNQKDWAEIEQALKRQRLESVRREVIGKEKALDAREFFLYGTVLSEI